MHGVFNAKFIASSQADETEYFHKKLADRAFQICQSRESCVALAALVDIHVKKT